MKSIAPIILLLFAAMGLNAQEPLQTVNAIIGDKSFIQAYNALPDETTDEQLRLQTHLSYVETTLRNKDVSHLSALQQQKRNEVLQLLHDYWNNGIFPANYDYPDQRRPCFIDKDGNICAVGYLIEMTAGRSVAEAINADHQYDYIMDMNNQQVNAWADEHGLTLEECAMIQPSYGPVYPPNSEQHAAIRKDYGISSGVLTGVNAAITMANLSKGNFARSKTVSYIGIATGAAQLILGVTNIKEDEVISSLGGYPYKISHRSNNNLSYVNMAAGSATIITSVLNLYINKNIKDKRNAVNLYSQPGLNRELNVGVSFARNF